VIQGPAEDVVPTIGFSSIEMKQINKFACEIYDLGGGAKIRDIWKNYFSLVHGIIYVVDSADETRMPEIKSNLQDVIQHERISKKPILV
jgi:ADP-ribosylation factor-like protein 13B